MHSFGIGLTKSQLAGILVFAALGFEPASETRIVNEIRRISPNGGTAFRDACIFGCSLQIKLANALNKEGWLKNWYFVQILLTDGEDTSSKTSLQDCAGCLYLLSQAIPEQFCRTILIGVELEGEAKETLQALQTVGNKTTELYNINSMNIEEIFDNIQVSLGILTQTALLGIKGQNEGEGAIIAMQKKRPVITVGVKNFVVLFNLDISGSMAGSKWRQVVTAVDRFISNLAKGMNFVNCIVFNSDVKALGSR